MRCLAAEGHGASPRVLPPFLRKSGESICGPINPVVLILLSASCKLLTLNTTFLRPVSCLEDMQCWRHNNHKNMYLFILVPLFWKPFAQ